MMEVFILLTSVLFMGLLGSPVAGMFMFSLLNCCYLALVQAMAR